MCQLCSENEEDKRIAHDYELLRAKQLKKISDYYYELGKGIRKPHNSKDLDALKPVVISIIRELVEEWI